MSPAGTASTLPAVVAKRSFQDEAQRPRLLDLVRTACRLRHYSYRTEQAYLYWIKQYVRFHGTRHPDLLGHAHVEAFLTHLTLERRLAAST